MHVNNTWSKREIWLISGGCAALFVSLSVIFITIVSPIPVIPDEIGYLSIAKYLATGEILNLGMLAPYRFGQGLLLSPGWLFTNSSDISYQIGIVLNCLATALIPAVLLRLSSFIGLHRNWQLYVASFLVAIFPAYLYQNSVVWPEAVLRILYLVLLFSMTAAWQTRRTIFWSATSFIVVALYAIHPRMLPIAALYFCFLIFSIKKGKISFKGISFAIIILTIGIVFSSKVDAFFVETIFQKSDPDGGAVQRMLFALTGEGGLYRVAIVIVGHLWAQIVSSFGLVIVGVITLLCMMHKYPRIVHFSIFAVTSSSAIFTASVGQMISFSRVDHIIYSRYNDSWSTIFVWIGLYSILSRPIPRNSLAIAAASTVGGFVFLWAVKDAFPSAGFVTPNLPALIWIGKFIPLGTAPLSVFLVVGGLWALVGMSAAALPRLTALGFLIGFILWADLAIVNSAFDAHKGRENYVNISRSVYSKVSGVIHRDRSAAADLDTVIDQYAAIGKRMPWSDIARSDINPRDATVVSSNFRKTGYASIGQLPNKSKLLIRIHSYAVEVGAPLRFTADGAGNLHKLAGWNEAEVWGSWATEEASLRIDLRPTPAEDLTLTLDTRMMLGPNVPQRTLKIECNDRPCGEFVYTLSTAAQQLHLPLPVGLIGQDGELNLRFTTTPAATPKSAGVNADGRSLGVGLTELTITESGEGRPAEPPPGREESDTGSPPSP